MRKLSTILLAVDGDHDDDTLLAEIESIASDSGVKVTILSVTEPMAGDPERSVAVSNLLEWETKVRSMQLEKLHAALSATGMQVDVRRATGKPYLEIIRETLSGKYDLVIKAATRDSGLKQFLLGGTDIQLLSLCPVPVWIFQPTRSNALKNIAVAVDLQPDDSERHALAEMVLAWGHWVAQAVSANLHVIHTWSVYREESIRSKPVLADTVDQLSDRKERLHRRWLDDILSQAGMSDGVQAHLAKGEARKLIPEFVNSRNIDLLVMGTVGRTGIPGFFIGNTADSVLRAVDCSVLTIKPENFATPVKPAAK